MMDQRINTGSKELRFNALQSQICSVILGNIVEVDEFLLPLR